MTKPTRRSLARTPAAWASLGVVAGAFALGWWFGRKNHDEPPAMAPSASASVSLQLDAGGVTLLPEGGLELKPITPLAGEGGGGGGRGTAQGSGGP
jgi:hypothetical protein